MKRFLIVLMLFLCFIGVSHASICFPWGRGDYLQGNIIPLEELLEETEPDALIFVGKVEDDRSTYNNGIHSVEYTISVKKALQGRLGAEYKLKMYSKTSVSLDVIKSERLFVLNGDHKDGEVWYSGDRKNTLMNSYEYSQGNQEIVREFLKRRTLEKTITYTSVAVVLILLVVIGHVFRKRKRGS